MDFLYCQSARPAPAGGAMEKRLLVTGAAMGIGLAVARKLASAGHRLVLMDVDGTALSAVLPSLPGAVAVVGSVADPQACERAVSAAITGFGGLDGVSHNAGIQRYGDVVTTPLETWDEVLAVNLTGAFLVARAAMPHLPQSRDAIVFTGAVQGMTSHP